MTTTNSSSSLPPMHPLNLQQLEAQRKLGRKNVDLEQLMTLAYDEAGKPAPVAPKPTPRWQTKSAEANSNSMTWSSYLFGSVTVTLDGHQIGTPESEGINSLAPIILKNQVSKLVLKTSAVLPNGIRLLHCPTKTPVDLTGKDIPDFEVSIEWDDTVPHTENSDKYDYSLVLVDTEGTFIQLEVGFSTRGGFLWLSFQETYAGQVARTTRKMVGGLKVKTAKVGQYECLAVPLYAENNYPDSDFLGTAGMVHGIIQYAVERGLSKPLSQCTIPKWEALEAVVEDKVLKPWSIATVTFFNLIWGGGFALLEDGRSVYLNFRYILDEKGRPLSSQGKYPYVNPMRQVAVRWKRGDKGLYATAIQALPLMPPKK